MYRRLSMFFGFVVAFLVGAGLVLGPAPDWLIDRWQDLMVEVRRYQMMSGTAGTMYLMAAGYLLLQGLYLVVRQLMPGGLRALRNRYAEYDASLDPITRVLSRFGLTQFLRRSIAQAESNPSTNHVSLLLVNIHGLQRVNTERGVLRGQELQQGVGQMLRDASVSRAIVGPLRWWRRLWVGPRSMQDVTPSRHPRCPARWRGSTFAMGMNGQDTRDAAIFARELTRRLDEYVRDLEPDLDLRVSGGLVLRPAGAGLKATTLAAEAALRLAAREHYAVAHSPSDGRAVMLQEFSDLALLEHDFQISTEDEEDEAELTLPPDGALPAGWLRRWGLALGCLALIPVLLAIGKSDHRPPRNYPWPDDLNTVDRINDKGVAKIPLLRTRGAAAADGHWRVEQIRIDQLQGDRQGPARLKLTILNAADRAQHISMYDVQAIDSQGRRLPVMAIPSMLYADALESRVLEPGERWGGWLQFNRVGPMITAVLLKTSRRSRLYIPFQQP